MSVATTLNAIRKLSSSAYQTDVPLTSATNITDVGTQVLNSPNLKEEFFNTLTAKVGLQLYNSKAFENDLMHLQKGHLEFGQVIEDIFIEMAEAHDYIPGTRDGESYPDPFEINKSIAKAGFYSTILGRQYFKTVHDNDLKRAFTSADGLNGLIVSIMQSISNGSNYDEYRMAIATLARQIEVGATNPNWKGDVHLLTDFNALNGTTLTVDEALNSKEFLTYISNQFQKWSKRLSKPRTDLNNAGVTNWVNQGNQRLMMLGDIQADMNTNLLAWAYNQDKLLIGEVDEIDSWYSIGADSTATPTTSTIKPENITVKGDLGLGGSKPVLGVLYDSNMVKIYSKTRISENERNKRGHYYNVFYTFEDIYACSPFDNYIVFFLD